MATEHNVITDPEIHEPKGASTAASGQVYVANGAGSGSWLQAEDLRTTGAAGSMPVSDGSNGLDMIRIQGWSQSEDDRNTVGSPAQTISTGVRTKWVCNNTGLAIAKDPSDLVNPLWDTTNFKHVPISAFDIYHIRMSFTAENYSGTSPYIELELDIGGSIGVIYSTSINLKKGGAAQALSWSFPVFSGTTYLANGGTFYITYNGTSTCDVYKNSILIVRESKNYV